MKFSVFVIGLAFVTACAFATPTTRLRARRHRNLSGSSSTQLNVDLLPVELARTIAENLGHKNEMVLVASSKTYMRGIYNHRSPERVAIREKCGMVFSDAWLGAYFAKAAEWDDFPRIGLEPEVFLQQDCMQALGSFCASDIPIGSPHSRGNILLDIRCATSSDLERVATVFRPCRAEFNLPEPVTDSIADSLRKLILDPSLPFTYRILLPLAVYPQAYEFAIALLHAQVKTIRTVTVQSSMDAVKFDRLLEAIVANGRVTRLELDDIGANVSVRGHLEALMDMLRGNEHPAGLEIVNVALSAESARELFESLAENTQLESLTIYANLPLEVCEEALVAFLGRPECRLWELDLYGSINSDGALALAQALEQNQSLRYLDLVENQIGGEGLRALMEVLRNGHPLRGLFLRGNRNFGADQEERPLFGQEEVNAIADMLVENSALRKLDIRDSVRDSVSLVNIARALRGNTELTWLALGGNGVDLATAKVLGMALGKPTSKLRYLELGNAGLNSRAVSAIVKGLHHNQVLSELDLSDNSGIGLMGISEVSEMLLRNQALTSLILSGCEMDDGSAEYLFAALAANKKSRLRTLELQANHIGREYGTPSSFLRFVRMRFLRLSDNEFDDESATRIASDLAQNPHIRLVSLLSNSLLSEDGKRQVRQILHDSGIEVWV